MAWLNDYQYRKKIPITGKTGASTNWQVNLTVHQGTGSDGAGVVYLKNHCTQYPYDIRFTSDDDVELKFWLDPIDKTTPRTFVVKITDDLSSDQYFYIYYGGPPVTEATLATIIQDPSYYRRPAVDDMVGLGATGYLTKCWDVSGLDETTDVGDPGTADFWLMGTSATVGTAFYYGYSAPYHGLIAKIGQLSIGTYEMDWEYYNGSTWEALIHGDDTNGWRRSEDTLTNYNTITWNLPSDWATAAVNGTNAYYVRNIVTKGGSITQRPYGNQILAVTDVGNYCITQPKLVKEGNTYYCFGESLEIQTYAGGNGAYRAVVATASHPLGPWDKLGFCLHPKCSAEGTSYQYDIQSPNPTKQDDTWYMFWSSHTSASVWQGVGYATASNDDFPFGWTIADEGKLQIPLGSAGSWDDALVGCPCVFYESIVDRWYCLYNGSRLTGGIGDWQIGIAESTGSDIPTTSAGWVKSEYNPIVPVGSSATLYDQGVVGVGKPMRLDGYWYFPYGGVSVASDWTDGYTFVSKQDANNLKEVWSVLNSGLPVCKVPFEPNQVFGVNGFYHDNGGSIYMVQGNSRGSYDEYDRVAICRLEYQPYDGTDVFDEFDDFNKGNGNLVGWSRDGTWLEEGQCARGTTDTSCMGLSANTYLNAMVETRMRATTIPDNHGAWEGIGLRKTNANDIFSDSGFMATLRYGVATASNVFIWCDTHGGALSSYALPSPDWSDWHKFAVGMSLSATTTTLQVYFDDVRCLTATDTHCSAAGYVNINDSYNNYDGACHLDYFAVRKWILDNPVVGIPEAESVDVFSPLPTFFQQ